MDVKLRSSKISLSGGSFNDFVEKILNEDKAKETKTASVKVAEEEEAETSGQPQAEAKLVNEPDKEDGTTGGSDNSEAETSGQPQAEAKLVNHPKVEASVKTAKENSDEPFGGKQAEPFKAKDDKDSCECEGECTCDKKDDDDKDDDKKEAKSINFVKIAKLNSKTKQMLLTYWSQLYPAEYAQAMVEEQ